MLRRFFSIVLVAISFITISIGFENTVSADSSDSTVYDIFYYNDETQYSAARKKDTTSFIYMNVFYTSSEKKNSFNATPQVDTHKGTGTTWVNTGTNTTVQVGKKYAFKNFAVENHYPGVQVRFKTHLDVNRVLDKINNVTIGYKWSPDFVNEDGVTVVR